GGKEGAKSENFAIAFLGSLTKDLSVETDMTLTGTTSHSVTIADGKTVTLDGVSISSNVSDAFGIRCLGDATIVLADGSDNTLNTTCTALCSGPSGTLTIEGNTGKLVAKASKDQFCAIGDSDAIGVGGNIVINGGVIEAYGGELSAAIGSGFNSVCGDITINGGDIIALGQAEGVAIGSGHRGSCGVIKITAGKVKATGGIAATGIGTSPGYSGDESSCGGIIITGGTVEAYGGENCPAIGCAEFASCSAITISGGSGTAYAGQNSVYSIGSRTGDDSCGTVTIGSTVTGSISQSPYSWNL
ncbi:MAG: hypothetical protein J6Y27_04175, partial [Bacteroidales bacterium]|nr:hypothetical protein [Bacteroidales bacterium]